jgi:hypothetical protein
MDQPQPNLHFGDGVIGVRVVMHSLHTKIIVHRETLERPASAE